MQMNKDNNSSTIEILFTVILVTVGFYYLFLLSTCNRNRNFVRIIEERYPKIYEQVMEEAEEMEADRSESQMRR